MAGFIAWIYVYGQASKMAQADGVFNRWNEEGFRQQYYDKFVAGMDSVVQVVEVAPQVEIQTYDPPAPGTGANYPDPKPQVKRGRPAKN